MNMAHLASPFSIAAVLAISLSGCNKTPTAGERSPAVSSTRTIAEIDPPVPAVAVEPTIRTALIASAERFENLTEAAFSNVPGEAAHKFNLAQAGAASIRTKLPADSAQLLDKALSDAQAAATAQDPAGLSLASNEAYRTVLSAAQGEAKIPLAIGLLDYAGFRVTADARAVPPRWDDMAKTLSYARRQSASVKSRIASEKVASDFDGGLTALDAAIAARDITATLAAATRELDQVDLLEAAIKP